MVAKDGTDRPPEKELGGEESMLLIPFDGPSIEGKRAVVSTASGLFKGIVMRLDRDGLDLAIDGKVKQFDGRDVRSIAAA